jgi:3'(2'), 5'-bisphosphate nucleotidase
MCPASSAELNPLLPEVIALAESAGERIREIYDQPQVETSYKSDRSPLTRADLESHALLTAGLARLAGHWPVLSEESEAVDVQERSRWSRFWLVDPLDGTTEFLQRNGEFTVNIALIEQGAPVLGVVHVPVTGATYFAVRGGGAYRRCGPDAAVALRVPTDPDHRDRPVRVVISRSHGNPATEAFLQRLRALRPGVELVPAGSSLKMCLVAAGEARLYPRLGPTMEWDTAAAQCVVVEAGGVMCDLQGQALRYNKADLRNPHFVVADASGIPWRDCLPP